MRLFTSESVTEGHPDKVCDQISDAVLDAFLSKDKNARVACEVVVTTNRVFIMGEITAACEVDIERIARETIRKIGYTESEEGFDADSCVITVSIDKQSPDIARGVNKAFDDDSERGAGDQGMMFGFACLDTKEFMPAPIYYSHALSRRLAQVRKSGELSFLRPDGKSQVTVCYDDAGKIVSIPSVVVSTQHTDSVSMDELREAVMETVIKPVLPKEYLSKDTVYYINPTGRFVVGGPAGDSGLTGRKIIVDTYGGYASHGGGCFSGKDPSKVDRSAAYMARYIAKNVVASGLASQCQLELAYAIGVARPVSVFVDTRGTGVISDEALSRLILDVFDMRPSKIISSLDLLEVTYSPVAAYGHFGRDDLDLPWEKLDKIQILQEMTR